MFGEEKKELPVYAIERVYVTSRNMLMWVARENGLRIAVGRTMEELSQELLFCFQRRELGDNVPSICPELDKAASGLMSLSIRGES